MLRGTPANSKISQWGKVMVHVGDVKHLQLCAKITHMRAWATSTTTNPRQIAAEVPSRGGCLSAFRGFIQGCCAVERPREPHIASVPAK